MKRKILTLLLFTAQLGLMAQGWPANYSGVMLQGFYWDSYEDAKWTNLTAQADELSTYFKLIWVPNSGQTKQDQWNSPGNWGYENMGYMPVYWLKHNTCFGTQEELITMINTFKQKGTGFIEDVVINHKNGLTNWADFPNETVTGPKTGKTYTLTWATDMQNLWGICSDDELFDNGGEHDGVTYICGDANGDEGDNFNGCRDLDHTNATVQQNVYNYLDFLLDELGYVGFRYDMVKGYAGYYTGLYNIHAEPEFSVGEYWDGNYSNVVGNWIDKTSIPNGTIQSAAFDFPLKDKINEAFNSGSWATLSNKGIAGDPNYSRYAVTFVDNHDTYQEEYYRVNNNVLAANAFILAMPGTPCIFLPHWKQYKPELKKMIAAREAAGITNQSPITYQYEVKDQNNATIGYYIKVTGTKGSVICTLGNLLNQNIDTDDHTLIQSGDNFAFYLWDGVYDEDTYNAIEGESAHDITVYVKDNGQGIPNLYVWNGGNNFNGGWPGYQLPSETVTLADGTSWFKKTFTASSINAIVTFGGDGQTPNIEGITDDIYLCYYKGENKYADYTPLYRGDAVTNRIYAYFDAPSGWNRAWAWSTRYYDVEDKNYTGGNWPGQAMTKVGTSSTGNDIYRWSISKNWGDGVPNSVIFNNNSGGQTSTLGFINGAYYDQNGIASEARLYFDPVALDNATQVEGVNWNGVSSSLAQGNSSTTMSLPVYYPAGNYTVQAIVRGSADKSVTLSVGEMGEGNPSTAAVEVTGTDSDSPSTVTADGVVERVLTGQNNGWQKVQTTYSLSEDGVLQMNLSSDAATWQVGAVTIVRNADTQSNYRTIATTAVTQTNADVSGASSFSFYERGVNKNALVTATDGQEAALLPCNVLVNGQCPHLVLTDGAYDFFAPSNFDAVAVDYDRVFTEGKKVTVCLPFAVTAAELEKLGAKAYEFDKILADGRFHFNQVDAMEANHPYVVMANGTPFASLGNKSVVKTGNLELDVDGVTFVGTMARQVLSSTNDMIYYGYSNGNFVQVGNNVGVNPFRAYIRTSTPIGSSVEAVFDEIDGIRELSKAAADAAVYGIDGRCLGTTSQADALPKGLYISNGKKFVVK